MGSAERRERARGEVRRRILDAAHESIAREGHAAVTMRHVAERIEYTPAALYSHFQGKLELMQALVQADFDALAQHMAQLAEVADPWEQLKRVGHAYVGFAVENPNHYKLMFTTKLAPDVKPEDSNKDRAGCQAYALVRYLAAAAVAGNCLRAEYQDPDLVAQLFWSAMHGVASLSIALCDSPHVDMRSIDQLTRSMIEVLMQGMAAPGIAPLASALGRRSRSR